MFCAPRGGGVAHSAIVGIARGRDAPFAHAAERYLFPRSRRSFVRSLRADYDYPHVVRGAERANRGRCRRLRRRRRRRSDVSRLPGARSIGKSLLGMSESPDKVARLRGSGIALAIYGTLAASSRRPRHVAAHRRRVRRRCDENVAPLRLKACAAGLRRAERRARIVDSPPLGSRPTTPPLLAS